MKKTILTLAVAAAGTMISGAASADFCGNYASSMVNINTQAARLGCNLTHPNWQHHYNWCVRNPPGRVNGALQSWQGRLNQCRPRQGGGGYGGGGYGGGGGGGPGYCNTWAQGMVALGGEAARKGCLQYGAQGLHTNFQAHVNWCLRNPPGRSQAAAARANQLLASCNR